MERFVNFRLDGRVYHVHFWPNGDVYSVAVSYKARLSRDLSSRRVERTLWSDGPYGKQQTQLVRRVVEAARVLRGERQAAAKEKVTP